MLTIIAHCFLCFHAGSCWTQHCASECVQTSSLSRRNWQCKEFFEHESISLFQKTKVWNNFQGVHISRFPACTGVSLPAEIHSTPFCENGKQIVMLLTGTFSLHWGARSGVYKELVHYMMVLNIMFLPDRLLVSQPPEICSLNHLARLFQKQLLEVGNWHYLAVLKPMCFYNFVFFLYRAVDMQRT